MEKIHIMPQNELKLGTTMDGEYNLALFIAETLGVEYKDGIINFDDNKEFVQLLEDMRQSKNNTNV